MYNLLEILIFTLRNLTKLPILRYLGICNVLHIWHTVWRVIFAGSNFRGKSEKALKINFRGFKFRDSSQYRGVALLHKR